MEQQTGGYEFKEKNIAKVYDQGKTAFLPDFYYSTSYDYKWIARPDNTTVSISLGEQEWMKLTDEILAVKVSGVLESFPLDQIQQIILSFKYLMAPLIIGGIVGPFGLVAMFTDYTVFWVSFTMIFTGIILVYLGIRGSWQVSVEYVGGSYYFFVDDKDLALESFIEQVNNVRLKKNRKKNL